MTSGTRDPVKFIRWREEGVRASDLVSVSVTYNVDDLLGFEGLTRCAAARELQDYCTEDFDAIVVSSVYPPS